MLELPGMRKSLGLSAGYINPPGDSDVAKNYAVLRHGDAELHLVRIDAADDFDEPMFRHGGPVDARFIIQGLDDYCRALESSGASIYEKPKDQPWESRDFSVLDLDGNKIWFAEEPQAKN